MNCLFIYLLTYFVWFVNTFFQTGFIKLLNGNSIVFSFPFIFSFCDWNCNFWHPLINDHSESNICNLINVKFCLADLVFSCTFENSNCFLEDVRYDEFNWRVQQVCLYGTKVFSIYFILLVRYIFDKKIRARVQCY